jgi:hypothetical protein
MGRCGMAPGSYSAQAQQQLRILLYEECSGLTLDLRSRMVTLNTLLVVFLKLLQKSLRSKVVTLAVLHFV